MNGIDTITTFLGVNLRKEIEIGSERADVSKKTTEEIIQNMEICLTHISKIIKKKSLTIHMFYILIDLYNHTSNRIMNDSELRRIINSDVFDEYNNDHIFCKGKAISASKIRDIRDKLSDILNDSHSDVSEESDNVPVVLKKPSMQTKIISKNPVIIATKNEKVCKSPNKINKDGVSDKIKVSVSDSDESDDDEIVYDMTDNKKGSINKPVLKRVVRRC